MRNFRAPTMEEWGTLLALASVLLGGWVYLYQPATAGFPINDGGLFVAMLRAVQENGYRLPAYVHYNGLNVPFAYPPLAFYVGAFITDLLHVDGIEVVRWLPAVVLTANILAIFGLAKKILKSGFEAGLATYIYTFTPRSTTWLIMGGGLTRSLGQLFLILTVTSLYCLYTERNKRHLAATILFGSLVILTHPEATVHAIGVGVLFLIFKGLNKQGLLDSIVAGAGIAVLTAIWWLPLLLRFGFSPFLSAGQTGFNSPWVLVYPLSMNFSEEPFVTLIEVFGLLGVIASLAKAEFLLPVWIFTPFMVEARGAATVAVIPLALLASTALCEVVFPAIAGLEERARRGAFNQYLQSRAVTVLFWYVMIALLMMAFYEGLQMAQVRVSKENRSAFEWVAAHTPADSRFLLITGDIELFCDPIQEWFPILTHRTSQSTLQGKEWISDGQFFEMIGNLRELQACTQSNMPKACIEGQAIKLEDVYDYLYIARKQTIKHFCSPVATEILQGDALISELEKDTANYAEVYRQDDVVIFSHQK